MFSRVGAIGAEVGLEFRPHETMYANTRTAHRLIQAAADTGLQHELVDAIFTQFFDGSVNIGESDQLQALADRVGLDPALTASVLADPEAFGDMVDRDLALAPQLGVSGVPFYVFQDTYGVSGAQSVEVLVDVLNQVHAELAA